MSRAGAIEDRNRDWGKGEERKGGGDSAEGDGLGEIKGCKFDQECNWNFLEQ